jgi:hypothetical protein
MRSKVRIRHMLYTRTAKMLLLLPSAAKLVLTPYRWQEMDRRRDGWFCTQTQTEVRRLREASSGGEPVKLFGFLSIFKPIGCLDSRGLGH